MNPAILGAITASIPSAYYVLAAEGMQQTFHGRPPEPLPLVPAARHMVASAAVSSPPEGKPVNTLYRDVPHHHLQRTIAIA